MHLVQGKVRQQLCTWCKAKAIQQLPQTDIPWMNESLGSFVDRARWMILRSMSWRSVRTCVEILPNHHLIVMRANSASHMVNTGGDVIAYPQATRKYALSQHLKWLPVTGFQKILACHYELWGQNPRYLPLLVVGYWSISGWNLPCESNQYLQIIRLVIIVLDWGECSLGGV